MFTFIELFDILATVYQSRMPTRVPDSDLVKFVLSQQDKIDWQSQSGVIVLSPRDDRPYTRIA